MTLLKDCVINTSHNSFNPGSLQVFNFTDPIFLSNLLTKYYVRCIELDVYSRNGVPEVGHGINGKILNIPTLLEDYLKIISDNFPEDEPLFLFLDIQVKEEAAIYKMGELFEKYFNDRIKLTSDILNKDISELAGKLFIYGSPLSNIQEFRKYIQGSSYAPPVKNINWDTAHKESIDTNNLYRIFPDNIILSRNPDGADVLKFWKKGVQMIALNFGNLTNDLKDVIEPFISSKKGVLPRDTFTNVIIKSQKKKCCSIL